MGTTAERIYDLLRASNRAKASVEIAIMLDAKDAEIAALRMKADSFDDFAKWLGDPRDDRHPGEIMADYQQKQREAAK